MIKGTRTVDIILNGGARKPVSDISDRAKRYRANSEENRPDGPEICSICFLPPKGNRPLDVDHIDGDESNGRRSNLQKLCRRCNTLKGAWLRRRGRGVLTEQFNPSKKRRKKPAGISKAKEKQMIGEYAHLLRVMRGEPHGGQASAEAFDKIMSFPAWFRSDFSRRAYSYRGGR